VVNGTANRSSSPLLVFADDWGRHPSSCQHLVRRLIADHDVVWANSIGTRRLRADALTLRRGFEKLRNWRRGLAQAEERMWVVDLPMLPVAAGRVGQLTNEWLVTRKLAAIFKKLELPAPIVLTTLPYVHRFIRGLPRQALVYYCTDDYSYWPDAQRETMQRAEDELSREADLVLGVSHALVARLSRKASCRYLPHGVDVGHFASTRHAGPCPAELSQLEGKKIGFFGLIYEKLDFDLLASVAKSLPAADLVMIGRVDYCPESFRKLPNVRFVGPQPYQDLPRWLAALDVLLLPYVDDEMIRQSSPLKLRECLASGKPTVSVDVPEARLLEPHVRVAGDRTEFVQLVRGALSEPDEASAARQSAVAEDDWNHRAEQLRQLLRELGSRRASRAG
jgi:glycosyltransferase involved in cell wall biosynthesis